MFRLRTEINFRPKQLTGISPWMLSGEQLPATPNMLSTIGIGADCNLTVGLTPYLELTPSQWHSHCLTPVMKHGGKVI